MAEAGPGPPTSSSSRTSKSGAVSPDHGPVGPCPGLLPRPGVRARMEWPTQEVLCKLAFPLTQ